MSETTIVARLRAWAADSVGCNPANAPCAEAADEIERLRSVLRDIAEGRFNSIRAMELAKEALADDR